MRLASIFQRITGGSDVRFQAYDGSTAGPTAAPVSIDIKTPEALSYLASAPGELGLARAYVTGHLEILGDVHAGLAQLSEFSMRELPWLQRVELLQFLGRIRLSHKVSPPPQENTTSTSRTTNPRSPGKRRLISSEMASTTSSLPARPATTPTRRWWPSRTPGMVHS